MFTKQLSAGSIGGEVKDLQTVLEKLRLGDFIPTGLFGGKTTIALKAFQKAYNIDTVGVLGPITRSVLNGLLPITPGQTLYCVATTFLGVDASPNDIASDELACAESVYGVLSKAFPGKVGFPFVVSTHYMAEYLKISKFYVSVPLDQIQAGDIYISPTTEGGLNGIKNGHVGIYDGKDCIMSNNSANGYFDKHFTLGGWRKRYIDLGGYKTYAFRRISF